MIMESTLWKPTMNLRWKEKPKVVFNSSYRPTMVLEQMWQGDKGDQKWEEVETVE